MSRLRFFLLILLAPLSCLAVLRAAPPSVLARWIDAFRSPEVLHLIEKVQDIVFDDRGVTGQTPGDRVVFTADLYDAAATKIGHDGGDCAIVRLSQDEAETAHCTISVSLPDGQITFQGLARFGEAESHFAITGGTGAYRRIQGEAVVRESIPRQEALITLTFYAP